MIDTKENEARGRMVCESLAFVVESLIESSGSTTSYDADAQSQLPPSKFEAFRAPGISIRDYVLRIHKYASCSPECFVLALVYIDRLQRRACIALTPLNVHRIVLTSVVLAAKFFDDHYFNNAYYAKVGGVLVPEMNALEIELLLLLNFSLHVAPDTYARFYNDLMAAHASSASASGSRDYAMRHFVVQDPLASAGQLVYVTDYVPRRGGASERQTSQRPSQQHHSSHSQSHTTSSGHYQQQPMYQQTSMYHPYPPHALPPAAPPQNAFVHHHGHHQQQPQVQYAHYQQQQASVPAHPRQYEQHYSQQHYSQQLQNHQNHQQQQQQQTYHHYPRTIEEPKRTFAAAAAAVPVQQSTAAVAATTTSSSTTPQNAAVRINAPPSRASGQKRRSAVALGVNA